MRFRNVCVEAVRHLAPPHLLTSDEIEIRLAPVYDRLHLPAGRLEMMSGIRERRYWPVGTKPGEISAQTAELAIQASGLDRSLIGAVVHGSVCRDQLEPATANFVHHACGLSPTATVLDISNACLGLLNGMLFVANMIDAGQIQAGLVVGTELGYDLVQATIDGLLANPQTTRQDVKLAFASLTIGSGSAAIVLCDRRHSRHQNRLRGGAVMCDTSSHELCQGGDAASLDASGRPQMQTDSEALLHAGVQLAGRTWDLFRRELNWSNADVTKAITHQVGKAHRKLLYQTLGLDMGLDYATVETLGNTGAAALPLTWSRAIEAGHLQSGDHVALLGIGSGLNCVMLGVEWQQG